MINSLLIFLAIVGFIIATYILLKRGNEDKMVCVVGHKCDFVLQSKYNSTFGINNAILGGLYYFAVIVLSLAFIYNSPNLLGFSIETILLIITVPAVIFSVYLTYVQFFVLKATCDYCISSAIVNILILIVELI